MTKRPQLVPQGVDVDNAEVLETVVPEVGMGVTVCYFTDRKAATVRAVSPSGKSITLQMDKATRNDSNGMSDEQDYIYESDQSGVLRHARWSAKNRCYKTTGGQTVIAGRHSYHDYSF